MGKARNRKVRLSGIITLTRRGFGFVSEIIGDTEDLDLPDIFIPPGKTLTALTGDRVEIKIKEMSEKGPIGAVTRVLERARHDFVGQISSLSKKSVKIIPVANIFGKSLSAPIPKGFKLNSYDWVKFSIVSAPDAPYLDLEITEQIPSPNVVTGILDGLTEEFDLPKQYSEDEEQMAASLEMRDIERKDLRDQLVLTIDPFDAKDFDDALSIVCEDDKSITIGIHIADVAAYVAPGSYFDEKARKRCFTNYLPGRMIPMLPKNLLRDKCSLNAGVDKPAHTVEVTLSKNSGTIISWKRYHSIINVRQRMHYGEVQEFFKDKGVLPCPKNSSMFEEEHTIKYTEVQRDWHNWEEDVQNSLLKIYDVYRTVHQWREAMEQFIQLIAKEIRVLCKEEPAEINGLHHEKSDEAHELIEEFMLMANTIVATEMHENNIPAVYRTHPSPDQEDVLNFSKWLKESFKRKSGSLRNRKAVNKFLGSLDKEDPATDVIMVSFLKTMQRACYDSKCEPHYGLGKQKYLHFTSPIRRYSDLCTHQQLWELENTGKAQYTSEDATQIASKCTSQEKNFDEAYWAANDRLKMAFVKTRLIEGDRVDFEGVIMSLSKSAMSVYLSDLGMFADISYSELDDYYELNANRMSVRGRSKGTTYKCGQFIHVQVEEADPITASMKLSIVEF